MNAPFVVLLTGARRLADVRVVGRDLYGIVIHEAADRPVVVRHGACPGPKSADQAAATWIATVGQWLGVTADPHPADWDHCGPGCPPGTGHRRSKLPGDIYHPGLLADYCPGAGPRRNAGMVAKSPRADLCLAAPHGASYGTRGCMKLAAAAGITVREVAPW